MINQMANNNYLLQNSSRQFKKNPIKLNYKKLDQNNGIAPYFLDVTQGRTEKMVRANTKSPTATIMISMKTG